MGLFGIDWGKNTDGDWAPDWMDLTPNKKKGVGRTLGSLPIELIGKAAQGLGGLFGGGEVGSAFGGLFTGMGNALDEYGDKVRERGFRGATEETINDAAENLEDNINDIFADEEEEEELPETPQPDVQTSVNLRRGRSPGKNKLRGVTSELAPWMLPTTTSRGFFGRFGR